MLRRLSSSARCSAALRLISFPGSVPGSVPGDRASVGKQLTQGRNQLISSWPLSVGWLLITPQCTRPTRWSLALAGDETMRRPADLLDPDTSCVPLLIPFAIKLDHDSISISNEWFTYRSLFCLTHLKWDIVIYNCQTVGFLVQINGVRLSMSADVVAKWASFRPDNDILITNSSILFARCGHHCVQVEKRCQTWQ